MSVGVRNRRIDLIQGVSILLVLLHHFNIAYPLADTALGRLLTSEAVHAVVRNGNYGVTMFFVVSGFLITTNSEKRWKRLGRIGVRDFYVLRIARIVPCLLLLLVDLLGAAGLEMFRSHVPDTGRPVSAWLVNLAALSFTMNVLIGHLGWVNYPLGVLWSLSVEEVFYLVFPLICLVLRRPGTIAMFWLAMIAVGPFYRMGHQADEAGFLFDYLACFDAIAVGCCTALLATRRSFDGSASRLTQALVLVGMIFLYLWRSIGETNIYGVTLIALGTATLLWTASRHPAGPIAGGSRVLRGIEWLGRLSYELYLFHLIVLGLLLTALPPAPALGDRKLLLLAVFMVVSAAAGAAIARVFSEPMNRRLRRALTSPRHPEVPAAAVG